MKSKKILTILLSLAIMFTFMPAMAFAAETTATPANEATWDLENHTVTVASGQKYGGVTVEFLSNGALGVKAPADANVTSALSGSNYDIKFYDLTGAEISNLQTNYSYANYMALGTNKATLQLKIYKPSYATLSGGLSAGTTYVEDQTLTGWDVYASVAALEESEETQEGKVTANFKVNGGADAERYEILKNSIADKKVYVQGTVVAPTTNAHFYEGKVDWNQAYDKNTTPKDENNKTHYAVYDGAEHVLTVKNAKGYTISYKKFNTTTAAWDTIGTDGIKIKNLADNGTYAAWYTNNTNSKDVVKAVLTVNMEKANTPSYTFASSGLTNGIPVYHYTVNNSDFDAFDFVEMGANASDAAKAEADAWKAYAKEAIAITQTPSTVDANVINLKGAVKGAGADMKALNAKNAEFLANYGYTGTQNTNYVAFTQPERTVDVTVKAVANDKEDDITFSGVTKKTYKAKKSTKKLAKAKSFTVSAVADSGNAVTFTATSTNSKIKINKTTGKVTVKKGLKKGTYKITVKAKTAAGNGYKACKESKTYTIKVK